jgi:hypothetical protein
VTSLFTERELRQLEAARRRAGDELAARTVWCGTGDAEHLRAEGDGAVHTEPLTLSDETFADVARAYAALVAGGVQPDDIVVLRNPATAIFVLAIRESGAEPARLLDDVGHELPHRHVPAMDAYAVGRSALLPCAEVFTDTVGGTSRPRPAVAAR